MRPAEPGHPRGGLLFVPVSGGAGTGELQRARLLALAAQQRWPQLPIRVLAASATLARVAWPSAIERVELPGSPTRHSAEVIATLRAQAPSVVVFDSTARPAQLAAAREVGAAVVYLSSRPSARRRGFGWRALRRIDEHWSVEISRTLLPSAWQRLLLRLSGAPRWLPLGTLFEPADASGCSELLRQFAAAGGYLLACPGGGTAVGAALYADAGRRLAAAGVPTILVRGDWPPERQQRDGELLQVGALPNAQLMALLGGAQVALLGAGSVLVQALALGTACVATALAQDQRARLQELSRQQAVLAVGAEPAALAQHCQHLWADRAQQARLREAARALGLQNGLPLALARLATWLPPGAHA